MQPLDTYEAHGFTVSIHADTDSESPRDWDNFGVIWTFERRYFSPDKPPADEPRAALESFVSDYFPNRDLDALDDSQLMALVKRVAIILPVYKFEHGGVAYSTGSFNDPWDSGQVGWTLASLDEARKEFGVGKSKRLTAAARAKAIALLKAGVETYSQYANGEVYGFVIEDEDGEHVDSCWGFYGFEYVKQEAEAAAKAEAEHRAKQRANRLKDLIRNRVPLALRAAELEA